MNIRNYIVPALLAGVALLSSSAQAATQAAALDVRLVIAGNCTITAGTLDFGTTGSIAATELQAQQNLTVNCTSGIPYTIHLNAGTGSSATVDMREMWDVNLNDHVDYTLHRTSYGGPIWGDGTSTSTTQSDTGTGADQTHTVYGVVPVQPTPPNDTYLDTVTVSVNW